MMTGQNRGRRRRGRRGQRSGQDAPQQDQATAQQVQVDENAGAPRETAATDTPAHESRHTREGDEHQASRQGGDAGRRRSRSKRRNNRRQTIGPMPTEVLKPAVRDVPVTATVAVRTLDEFSTQEGMTFGCPMLSRTRIGLPFASGRRVPRCSMGWALHDEDEALLCMRTPDLLDCWKEHPEKEAALRANQETENAAD